MSTQPIPPPTPERPWTLWSRRMVSIPLLFATALMVIPLWPPALAIAAVIDLVRGGDFPLARGVALIALALGTECVGVLGGAWLWLVKVVGRRDDAWFHRRNFDLQRLWAKRIYHGVENIFGFHTEVEGLECLRKPGRLIVFIRHTSVADTLLPIIYIGVPFDRHLRFVLKSQLLWDPCLNLVGSRLGNVFVRRQSGHPETEVRRVLSLLHKLGPNEGVLIYPEATRFSEAKRQRALEHLREGGDPKLLELGSRFKHVLPPRPGGPLALLRANPGADVVFCGHHGFDGVRRIADMFAGTLTGITVKLNVWRVPYEEIPTGEVARRTWLFEQWHQVDNWVDSAVGAQEVSDQAQSEGGCRSPDESA